MMLTLLLAFALDAQVVAKDDTQATAAQDARFAAMVKGNADYLDAALDASLTYQHSNGSAQTKAEFLGAIRAGALKYKGLEAIERRVRRFGSVVIITGVIRLQAMSDGEVVDTKARFTDVYESRNGRLIQVAWQTTRIQGPHPGPTVDFSGNQGAKS
ncbi:MAG: nuclear transport factor 2 family protein [Vicinamibacteria bacterium]